MTDPTTTRTFTLSLHDALPISQPAFRWRCGTTGGGSPTTRDGEDGRDLQGTWCRVSWQGAHRTRLAAPERPLDRKSTRLNSSHSQISYAVFCLKKKMINVIQST